VIQKLLVATNKNDILDRFFRTGSYERINEAVETLSPAMDIQISSNFERYLFYLAGCDGTKLKGWMEQFKNSGRITIEEKLLAQAKTIFESCSVSDAEVRLFSIPGCAPFWILCSVFFRLWTASGDILKGKGQGNSRPPTLCAHTQRWV
jgi:hypothetical protein